MYIYMYICMYVCMYVYIYIYMHTYITMDCRIYTNTVYDIYIYIYIYIHIYTHAYTYIYIYIERERESYCCIHSLLWTGSGRKSRKIGHHTFSNVII